MVPLPDSGFRAQRLAAPHPGFMYVLYIFGARPGAGFHQVIFDPLIWAPGISFSTSCHHFADIPTFSNTGTMPATIAYASWRDSPPLDDGLISSSRPWAGSSSLLCGHFSRRLPLVFSFHMANAAAT